MSAAIIDGRVVAAAIESELRARVARLGSAPRLAVVQVGNDPASTSYIRAKSRAAERVGV
ncbi:MAG TPA: bifunctional 5,10-methylene-tetrahydrofolate dehydrogenase/5,10-methylene-tetrahydrofolate cyclohydrolase, partial [Candidatus Poseidoniales archaeon]|nr:bifunctional 5,10-methylene-tetrahydrofolate dehydrogenase/5,10-methylene-tetrahydrofolate cyclohydrolase [Candidatus Poseidoniales archaeon]